MSGMRALWRWRRTCVKRTAASDPRLVVMPIVTRLCPLLRRHGHLFLRSLCSRNLQGHHGHDVVEFGKLSEREVLSSEYLSDDDDGFDRLEMMKRRRPISHYDEMLWRLRSAGGPNGMKKAMEIFEQMCYEDHYEASKKHYTIMISGCAEFGLVEKAFYFFNLMLKKKMRPTKAAVTALLNACAEARSRDKALEKLEVITDWIRETSYPCNIIQYNAMVKAYARHGDLRSAFAVTRDMREEGHDLNSQTYCMLLMGCITDRMSGMSHAIRIVREMMKRMPLDVNALNLFLRVVRDSAFGSEQHLTRLFPTSVLSQVTFLPVNESQVARIKYSIPTDGLAAPVDLLEGRFPTRGICLDMSALTTASNRLSLIGGFAGIVRLMDVSSITPTSSTMTALLDCIPASLRAEADLIAEAESRGVILNTSFFNRLVWRRAMRKDIVAAKDALRLMQIRNVSLDVITFGSLAIACSTHRLAFQLIEDMKNCGFKLDNITGGALVRSACHKLDLDFVRDLLLAMEKDNAKPQVQLLERIEEARLLAQEELLRLQRSPGTETRFKNLTDQSLDRFNLFYKQWLRKNSVQFPEPEEKQFDFEVRPSPRTKMNQFEDDMCARISEVKGIEFKKPKFEQKAALRLFLSSNRVAARVLQK